MLRSNAQVISPVSVTDAARHAVLDGNEDLYDLSRILKAATSMVQVETARQFLNADWTLTIDCFPPEIELRVCPVVSVTSVKYYDTSGVQQTLDPSEYIVDTAGEPGRIVPVTSWPETQRRPNAIEVVFTAGYGDSVHLQPESAQQAILLLAGHFYANREAVSATSMTEVPLAVRSLINSLRWTW